MFFTLFMNPSELFLCQPLEITTAKGACDIITLERYIPCFYLQMITVENRTRESKKFLVQFPSPFLSILSQFALLEDNVSVFAKC